MQKLSFSKAVTYALLAMAVWLLCGISYQMGRFVEVSRQVQQAEQQMRELQARQEQIKKESEFDLEPACGLDAVICNFERVPKKKPAIPAVEAAAGNTGKASWYAKGLKNPYSEATAASRFLPRGSRALVVNIATGKSVEVLINDYGPSAELHPDRVIDLSAYAFQQLAPLNSGVISVSVTPIK